MIYKIYIVYFVIIHTYTVNQRVKEFCTTTTLGGSFKVTPIITSLTTTC